MGARKRNGRYTALAMGWSRRFGIFRLAASGGHHGPAVDQFMQRGLASWRGLSARKKKSHGFRFLMDGAVRGLLGPDAIGVLDVGHINGGMKDKVPEWGL